MASNKKSTMNATLIQPLTTKSSQTHNTRVIQNFHLVWLDGSINEIKNDDCHNSVKKLRHAVNTVNTFTDADECIDFITDIKETTTFMIISRAFSRTIIPMVQDISQVSIVYILCQDKIPHEKWAKECSKVKGIYTDIISICEALEQAVQDCDQNAVSIGFLKSTNGTSNPNLNTLDQTFMYTQILKEILLTIDFEQAHIDEFLKYCREQFVGNTTELKNVDKIENEYHCQQPIWWYTYPCFLYSMLNKALRTMEVDLIIKMGFFVQALHNHIVALNVEQYGEQNHSDSFIVYRGQGLSQIDFDQLKKLRGGLMSFNNFLSTSIDQAVSFAFAESNQYNPNVIGVLFEININPSISSSVFASVGNATYFKGEEEILFSMHSVFRIGQVKQIDGNHRLWQVDLTLTSDTDPELHALTESIRQETFPHQKGWYRLGNLLLTLGQSKKAQQVFDIMLEQTPEQNEKANIYQTLGQTKFLQGEYRETITYFEKSLEILQKTLPANHPLFAASYSNIGGVHNNMGEYSKALSYYERALEIRQKIFPANHPDSATLYNNIGFVYRNLSEYSKALFYYEKVLEIWQKTLPANHPHLATSYNNIGMIYDNIGEYSKALSCYEKSFEIRQKTLPENHPDSAQSYSNIGLVYDNMGEYSKALSYYEKALKICQKTLSADHPDLATSYNNIGGVYINMGGYSKALSYYEKALKICQKTLSADHPLLATSYNNIGVLYYNMGDYSKAISYSEQARKIRQKTLSENHPDVAQSYTNTGEVYRNMGDYSNALSYYEKALKICQKTLPANHPDLATSYNNIGLVYYNMGKYPKALSYLERALHIFESSVSPNHPDIKLVRESIKVSKKKL